MNYTAQSKSDLHSCQYRCRLKSGHIPAMSPFLLLMSSSSDQVTFRSTDNMAYRPLLISRRILVVVRFAATSHGIPKGLCEFRQGLVVGAVNTASLTNSRSR